MDGFLPYLRAFLCGGTFCLIGQILIDRTKLTPAKILVLYVVSGVILGGLGIYQHIVDFGGAGATVPLTGFGYLLSKGVTKAVAEAKHPLAAIVGGSKVSTKLTILSNLAQKVDQLIVGGGIANTFLMAAGFKVGKSLAEPELVGECAKVLETLKAKGASLPLPVDVVVAKEFSATAEHRTCAIEEVADDEMILDVGPKTAQMLADVVSKAGTIVWNGPVGVFEMEPYSHGTEKLAQAIAEATDKGAFSIAGGGDTVSAVSVFGIKDRVSYISTGGGAFLEFLEGKTLPAVAVLEARAEG